MGINLDKRTETAGISLVKQMQKAADAGIDLGEVSARVVLAMDHSYSALPFYRNGMMQDTAERSLALSLTGLDDDGDIQVIWFDDKVAREDEVNINTYQGYIQKNWNENRMGGTRYSPVLERLIAMAKGKRGFMRKTGPAVPLFALFLTDGEPANSDKRKTEELLRRASEDNIFIHFVCFGGNRDAQQYLDSLNNLDGRTFDNTGLTVVNNVAKLSDEKFFDEILGEFVTEWLPQAKARGVAL